MLTAPHPVAAIAWNEWLKVAGLLVAIFLVAVGGLVLWSNPRRAVNRVVFICALHNALWLFLLYYATAAAGRVFWLRCACAVAALLAMHFAVARETIATGTPRPSGGWVRGLWLWIAYSVGLATLCFTNYFIPFNSTAAHRMVGMGYYLYIVGEVAGYAWVVFRTFRVANVAEGIRRIELQYWLTGYSAMCLAVLGTMVLNTVTHNPIYIRLQPLFVFAFYTGTAYAVTTSRIFEASQLARVILTRAVPGAAGLVLGGLALRWSIPWLGVGGGFVLAFVAGLTFTELSRRWLEPKLQLYPQDTAARRAAFEAARRETRVTELEADFANVLKGWGGSEKAWVTASTDGSLRIGGTILQTDDPAVQTARQLGWLSPERLAREKGTPGRRALAEILERERLGVAVLVQGPSISVLSAVGVPASHRSFNYPQITQLVELTSIFEGPLERALLAEKIQHTEQLATVGMLGASLAHEIRNPLVSLKAFVQLLPTRHHEPAFREKFFALMTEEVKRIDRLTEQLLDLASPRAYLAQPVRLNAVIQAGLDLVKPRASEADVEVRTELAADPDLVSSDPAAIKQVLLNLCLNAIQVLEGTKSERWIRIRTVARPGAVELSVEDSGPGISPAIRAKLFQPFQSTKSSGFGLGLAICRDILSSLDASIVAAPFAPGKGAEFRIVLPCPR